MNDITPNGSLFQATDYEYGVRFVSAPDEPHRSQMTGKEAQDWLQGWWDDGGRPDAFVLIRRPVGEWEEVASV